MRHPYSLENTMIIKRIPHSESVTLSRETLFIFPDNVLDSCNADPDGDPSGMRPYNKFGSHREHPLTAGVPVAWSPWGDPLDYFEELSEPHVKRHIRDAVKAIRELIEIYNYTTISFKVDADANFAGESPLEIRLYITKCLDKLAIPKTNN